MNADRRTNLPLIPKPIVVNVTVGDYHFSEDMEIYVEQRFRKVGQYLQELLEKVVGTTIPLVKTRKNKRQISLERNDDPHLPAEGYVLNNVTDVLTISSSSAQGIFYGIQTMRQLLTKEDGSWQLPKVIIRDYPRFSWRGFMLDEARHFMGKKVVKQLLDVMAFLKLNKFHWHLVDDQGWRIEIKRYPKLTEVGSKRKLIARRGEKPLEESPTTYGGFYTQEEIKEIVAYAQERFIEVIPEIEIPGHSSAAIAAYPELSCSEKPIKVPTRWGIFKNIYCAGKERVYQFLKNVLTEILTLFPSKFIHIGGDEVIKTPWRSCVVCQRKIIEEQLESVDDLQPFMTNYFAAFLRKNKRQLMGWSQILHPRLKEKVLCQHWFGNKDQVMKFLREGGKVVSSEMLSTYLDYPYTLIPLKKAYKFEPIPSELEEEFTQNIIGLEAPLWTERVSTFKRLCYQAFPRLVAYAETAWTPKTQKNYARFLQRLEPIMKILQTMGIVRE